MSHCEYGTFYTEKRVLARKEHTCCETHRTIQKGEYYWRCVGVWDKKLSAFPQSEAAYHFARWINKEVRRGGFECVEFGGIGEEVGQEIAGLDDPLWLEWLEVCKGVVTRGPAGCNTTKNEQPTGEVPHEPA